MSVLIRYSEMSSEVINNDAEIHIVTTGREMTYPFDVDHFDNAGNNKKQHNKVAVKHTASKQQHNR